MVSVLSFRLNFKDSNILKFEYKLLVSWTVSVWAVFGSFDPVFVGTAYKDNPMVESNHIILDPPLSGGSHMFSTVELLIQTLPVWIEWNKSETYDILNNLTYYSAQYDCFMYCLRSKWPNGPNQSSRWDG